ncbi:MAG: minichromosome maintenance protein MCM [archaeon]|nr:minichromosome maintenance protein MCM [archaeon]
MSGLPMTDDGDAFIAALESTSITTGDDHANNDDHPNHHHHNNASLGQEEMTMPLSQQLSQLDPNLESYLYTFTEAPTELIELENRCIWGTTVNIEDSKAKLRYFFGTFADPRGGGVLYHRLLLEAIQTQRLHIDLDCGLLHAFNPALYSQLVRYPQELLPIADICLNEMCQELLAGLRSAGSPLDLGFFDDVRLQLRTHNLARVHSMRELNPIDVDTLISIRGMVIRASPIIPELKEAYFECERCKKAHTTYVDRGWVTEPAACSDCRVRRCLRIVHNRCIFANKQMIKLQETPDSIPEGETPNSVTMFVFDDLVDVVLPGDRVTVTGIFRATPTRKSPIQRNLNTLYRTHLDAIHFHKSRRARQAASNPESDNTIVSIDSSSMADSDVISDHVLHDDPEALERRIQELAALPDIQERLLRSFAPSIWEMDDVKKALLCQLFGGVTKASDGVSMSRLRGDINILLCGDPGTSKSQLLQYVHKLAPRGIYTSGKGSSAVGLTAYVTRDPDTHRAVLESGALVLSDGGICCIDEFDKMSDQTRSILHEAMEQQTVSVAKAGIICTLNARTSVLAAANPRESRYNPRLSVIDNIQLDPPLLSRFDFIFLVLDKPNAQSDTRLARHIVSLFYSEEERANREHALPIIPIGLLSAYINHAKTRCKPRLSDEAVAALAQGYVDMRKVGISRKTITATPRQLESTIRISEALCKMRLGDVVTEADVDEALRLLRGAMQHAAMDPRTGTIDMDLITTGRSAYSRMHFDELRGAILSVLKENVLRGSSVSLRQFLPMLQAGVSSPLLQSEVRDALIQMTGEEASEVQFFGDRIDYGRTSTTRRVRR